MDELTHLDMAEAVADVAVGAIRVATWSAGRGLIGRAGWDARGRLVVSTHDAVTGRALDANVMQEREAADFVALATRSAA